MNRILVLVALLVMLLSVAGVAVVTATEEHDNRCDDLHPEEGNDDNGHNNPDCDDEGGEHHPPAGCTGPGLVFPVVNPNAIGIPHCETPVPATEPLPAPSCVDVIWFVAAGDIAITDVVVTNVDGGWSPDGEVLDTIRNRPGFIVCPNSLPTGLYNLYINGQYAAQFDLVDNFRPSAVVMDFPANGVTLFADPLAPVEAFDWDAINS